MRRLPRLLASFCGGTLLLLSLALIALWLRSYWRSDSLYHARGGRVVYTAYSGGGGVRVIRWVQPHESLRETEWMFGEPRPKYPTIAYDQRLPGRLGFEWNKGVASPTPSAYTSVVLPTWTLVLVPAAPGGLWAMYVVQRQRRPRRLAQGRCEHCGYDLRASSDRCPECGLVLCHSLILG